MGGAIYSSMTHVILAPYEIEFFGNNAGSGSAVSVNLEPSVGLAMEITTTPSK